MCQLLGMNCNVPTDIVFSFTGFAHRGGHTDTHHDGWGIAFFEGTGVRHFVDHQAAVASPIAELIKRYPIKSTNVIAHIRKATVGQVALENCHPFVRELWGRYWVFAHNGDLKAFAPVLDGAFRPVGTTTASWPSASCCKACAASLAIRRPRAPRSLAHSSASFPASLPMAPST